MERIRRFFKKFRKTVNAKGYTLIEVACVVAVTATLAAVALPVVKSNVLEAKTVAATENMNNLAGAIQKYYGDTTFWPNLGAKSDLVAVVLRTSDLVDKVVTDSNTTWIGAKTVTLSEVLTQNVALRASWKGPYSSKPELFDPWGHPYYVAIEDDFVVAGDPNHKTAIYVLSAGPDEIIQTLRNQDMQSFAKAVGSDDIVLRIR